MKHIRQERKRRSSKRRPSDAPRSLPMQSHEKGIGLQNVHGSIEEGLKAAESNGAETPTMSAEFIDKVQEQLERCLMLYMTLDEALVVLENQAGVPAGVTKWVWDALRKHNEAFFKAYELRLRIKDQILAFNFIVTQQAQMMTSMRAPTPPPPSPPTSGQALDVFGAAGGDAGLYARGPPTLGHHPPAQLPSKRPRD